MPSYQTCNKITSWHFPWNKKKFKQKCEENNCLWTKSVFGSYCLDPYTVTRKKINGMGLNNPIVQASITVSELKRYLKICNVADENNYNILVNEFLQNRIHSIIEIVVYANSGLIIKTEDYILEKIIKYAKEEKIKDIKTISELKLIKLNLKEICFNKHLGNNRYNYKYLTLFDLKNKLNICNIKSDSYLYSIAYQNYRTYSEFLPKYYKSRRHSRSKRHHRSKRHSRSKRHHRSSSKRHHRRF